MGFTKEINNPDFVISTKPKFEKIRIIKESNRKPLFIFTFSKRKNNSTITYGFEYHKQYDYWDYVYKSIRDGERFLDVIQIRRASSKIADKMVREIIDNKYWELVDKELVNGYFDNIN